MKRIHERVSEDRYWKRRTTYFQYFLTDAEFLAW
jgi:hypothetical protein